MRARGELQSIKKKMGMDKTEMVFACGYGYNDDDEVLFDVLTHRKEKGLTEAEISGLYSSDRYWVNALAVRITNGKGGYLLDEKGRPQLADLREL